MDKRFGRRLDVLIRPLFLVAGFIEGYLCRVLFPRRDEKLAKESQQKLEADIRVSAPFLFAQMKGHVIANEGVEFPPPFDYAIVTMDLSTVLLRFTRGREHLAVQVAPTIARNAWSELSTVLNVLEIPGIRRGSVSSLTQAGELLQCHMNDIVNAFAADEYPQTRARLEEIYARDRIATKQLETEINRNLYG